MCIRDRTCTLRMSTELPTACMYHMCTHESFEAFPLVCRFALTSRHSKVATTLHWENQAVLTSLAGLFVLLHWCCTAFTTNGLYCRGSVQGSGNPNLECTLASSEGSCFLFLCFGYVDGRD